MSLYTFWAWVAVMSVMMLVYLIGCEHEARERWREWERRTNSTPCPVGEIANDPHTYRAGSGVVVEWSVMGDPRRHVEVCKECARGVTS